MKLTSPPVVYLPDSRGVEISRFGKGNLKIGAEVFTYSRMSGPQQTCPGASDWCRDKCYALRVADPVASVWRGNTGRDDVPEIPVECLWMRAHIGGDFDSVGYIVAWWGRLVVRPDVTFWAYTRSWRVPELLEPLESLRALPNVQLFASMDESIAERPPEGWRVAWIQGDSRANGYTCPEETGRKRDCLSCRYCFDGKRGNVVFLKH